MKLTRLIAILALILPMGVQAQQDWREVDWGDFILRLGGSYIHPDDNATSLKYVVLQHWDLYNTSWEFDSDITWNISGVWRPMDNWGIELMHINGAQYDVDLDRFTGIPGQHLIELGEFKASSTNAFVNWYGLDSLCLGRPYIGIGVNYTDYHDVKLSREFSNYLIDSDLATRRGKFNLGHSWGWAAQAGVDFNFGPDIPWLANLAVLYFKSDTDARVTFPTRIGHDHFYADVDYDPWIINLGVGYKF